MSEAAKYDEDALLAQAGWVRALARHLTADAHTADDLAQDALAAALARISRHVLRADAPARCEQGVALESTAADLVGPRGSISIQQRRSEQFGAAAAGRGRVRPPPSDRPLRSWLGAIVRNLARQDRRAAGRRGARERVAARDEAVVSAAQSLERLDSLRAVVEAVTRLEEPYRATILMRYFEGLSPSAIAARTETPLRTVHTRLHRALARLRSDLDRAHGGDRNTWLLALIPFARGSGWPELGAGALIVDAKLKIALAIVAVVGVCSTFVLWRSDAPPSVSAPFAAATPASESATSHAGAPLVESSTTTVARRVDPGAPETGAAPPVAPLVERKKLAGRVIDVDRAPVAHVKVRYVDSKRGPSDGVEVETDANGMFELDDPKSGGQLDIASAGWTSVYRPEFSAAHDAREFVLVVARSVALAGVVVDEAHRPLAGASVAVPLPFGLRTRFDTILDRSTSVERGTTTDEQGRFELPHVPLVPGATLATKLAAFVDDERDVPAHDELALEIVLREARAEQQHLLGTVVDVEGNAVEGAWVALGSSSTKSGRSGAFALELAAIGDDADSATLRAAKPGHLPAELVRANGGAWPSPLVLQLGGPPLSIEGRVVDAEGKPVPHAEVWSSDETRFGFISIDGGEMAMRAGANVEAILRDDPWTWRTRADASGRFVLRGLLPHDYRIHAVDRTRVIAATATFAAGVRNAEIRMPKEDLHERVAGRVTSLSGDPLAGVDVVLERRSAGDTGGPIDRVESATATTDHEGRFEFENVSRAIHVVGVRGSDLGITGFEHPLAPGDDVRALEIVVPLIVHVQIDAGGRTDFDRVATLDAAGEKLYLSVQHGQSSYAMKEIRLEDGRTEPFSTSEAARTLVLFNGEIEVQRVPLRLVRGELNTIRP